MFLNPTRIATVSCTEPKETQPWASHLFFPFLILVALIAPLVRIDDLSYLSESLLAEDGWLFINQSHELGFSSLWAPHAGYQFLYNRVVALLASPIPLSAIPYVFFLASLMPFVAIAGILKYRAKYSGLNEPLIAFLVCAIALQPNYGDAFFNLNLSIYFLGIALAFHVCIPSRERASVSTITFLILASLSGPFSAFMIPILALQLTILRDFSSRKATYIVVPVCGLIQSSFLFRRAGNISIHANAADWLQAISSFIFFGGSNKLTYAAASIFWAILLVFFYKWIATQARTSDRILWLSPILAALTALLLYFAGAWSSQSLLLHNFLPRLSPITDFTSRYFLIPYSLVFFIAVVCTRDHRAAQTAVISLISVICGAGFLTVDRAERASRNELMSHFNLQWTAFTKFRKIKSDIIIPVNPSGLIYPPLGVQFKNAGIADGVSTKHLNYISLRPQQNMSEIATGDFDSTPSSSATEIGPTLYFDIKDHCVSSNYLALEVDIWRSRMGWAKVYWGQPGRFKAERSLERLYLDGSSVMQFAFRRDLSDYSIRFDPAEGVESEALKALSDARETLARSGLILAEPTKPGGEFKINAVRLFCLE